MLGRFLGLAVLAMSSMVEPANATEPISDWTIEPSDARCVAVRKYGTADKPITLALKAPPAGQALQLAVIRDAYRKTSDQVGATVDIDGKSFRTHALGYPLDRNKSVSLIHLSPDAATAMRDAQTLGITIKGSFSDRFALGNMGKAWPSMDACLDRLRSTWNIGEMNGARIATAPRAIVPIQGMFSGLDYPPQAVRQMFAGTTAFLLLIDEKGAVKDCTLTETSGMAVIDSRTCALITYKARFAPALGADGKPVKGTHAQRITWRIEP